MKKTYDLNRFMEAQNSLYPQVIYELKRGRKTSHWIWFIFPQIKGLGQSPIAKKFEISSSKEALAYLKHPILGSRLHECSELLMQLNPSSIREVLGEIDSYKLRSSMTLFKSVAPEEVVFQKVLDEFFNSREDDKTIELLSELEDLNGELFS